jgi:hypothetical protein
MSSENKATASAPRTREERLHGTVHLDRMRLCIPMYGSPWEAIPMQIPGQYTAPAVDFLHKDFKDMSQEELPASEFSIPRINLCAADYSDQGTTVEEAREELVEAFTKKPPFPNPNVVRDEAVEVGDFTRVVEVLYDAPPSSTTSGEEGQDETSTTSIHHIAYFCVFDGVYYAYQMIAAPAIVEKYREQFVSLVRSSVPVRDNNHDMFHKTVIECPLASSSSSSEPQLGTFELPPSWIAGFKKEKNVDKSATIVDAASICDPSTVIASAQSPSRKRPETVVIVNALPASLSTLKKVDARATVITAFRGHKIGFSEYISADGTQVFRVLKPSNKARWLVCGSSVGKQIVTDKALAKILISISTKRASPVTTTKGCVAQFRFPEFWLCFDVLANSELADLSVGPERILYAPLGGIDILSGEDVAKAGTVLPLVVIDVVDSQGRTLDDMQSQIAGEDPNASDVRREKLGEYEFLRVVSAQMTGDVGEDGQPVLAALRFAVAHFASTNKFVQIVLAGPENDEEVFKTVLSSFKKFPFPPPEKIQSDEEEEKEEQQQQPETKPSSTSVVAAAVATSNNTKIVNVRGLKVKLPEKWRVLVDNASGNEKVTATSFAHEDFADKDPRGQDCYGEIPTVLIVAEDMVGWGEADCTVNNIANATREQVIGDLTAYTNGEVPPKIVTDDSSVKLGQFEHFLVVDLHALPRFNVRCWHYFSFRGKVSYDFQVFAHEKLLEKYGADLRFIAENATFE